ncbi:GNAT family N-acetyltransferase [Paracoccus subflavus]|uniref:GNAT family N-acetyltransferase n=1 Tax=Paracoccus subflavus TaxID=2528244 RepID=A0A4Q9G3W3_9RHOB|nr:GNAT family N-acetyltransferase [Paracoccus subflavus]TBN41955.1 GNAT family N-acetyltransferase [Paracoccus subflavus]
MTCTCGHDHAPPIRRQATGSPVDLRRPMVGLTGRLVCSDVAQVMTALSLLPDHARLSREEPGCLHFDLWQDKDDPSIWHLSELFADADALAAHVARTRNSPWGQESTAIGRDIQQHEVAPVIRPETRHDSAALDALLRDAFGGDDERRLLDRLREDGDLSLSLVADAGGVLVGHVAMSPLQADGPAYLMAPVSVASKAQRRGIGTALVRHALSWADPAAVVVVGHPRYYTDLGFRPSQLDSPYAGLSLQMIGDLAPGSAIRPAAAFIGI